MREKNQSKWIIVILMVLISIIMALISICICTNTELTNSIAQIFPSQIVHAAGVTGVSVGTNVVANFDEAIGKITISSTSGSGLIAKDDFGSFIERCGATNIRTITFTNEVYLPIESDSLYEGLSNLANIENAQYMNVSNVTTFYKTFSECTSLTTIDVSNWNTQNVDDFSYMFNKCNSLTELNVSNWNVQNAKQMNYMFSGCGNLARLDVSNWNIANVTTLYKTFQGCEKVTELGVSNWNTEKVVNMCSVFDGCRELREINVSNWNIANVEDISFIFKGCEKLTTVDVSRWDTGKVENMNSAFNGCNELTTIDVSHWNIENTTSIELIFNNCKKLTTIDVSNWKTSNVANFGRAFMGCNGLTHIDVSRWDTGNAWNLECIFHNCTSLEEIDVSNWNTENATNMYAIFWNCNKLTTIDVSRWNTSKVTNMAIIFEHCIKLTDLDVSNWNTENVTSLYGAFHNCSSLTELNVSDWKTQNVTDLCYTFCNCTGLTELDISNWNTDKVTNMNNTFSGLSNVTTLDLRNWNTANVTQMENMFNSCSSLKKLDLRSFDFSKVTNTENFLSSCNAINEIYLPAYTSSETIILPDRYRDAEKPEKADIYHTEINSTLFAEPTHLFRGIFISFDLGIADNYILTEYEPHKRTKYYILEEETNTGGTEGKGKDILPITIENYSDNINIASIIWNENTFEQEKGYKFTNWSSSYDDSVVGVPYVSNVFNEDITYTAIFEALEVNYTVKHYQENLNNLENRNIGNVRSRSIMRVETNNTNDNYTLVETENLKGITDTKVTPETKNYIGFTTPTKKQVTILGDGSTIVHYYYDRNQYNLTLTKDEGIGTVSGEGTYYYEQEVNIGAEVNEDYVWGDWTVETAISHPEEEITQQEYTFQMPAEDITLRANSIKKTNIEIYYIDETNNEIIEDKKIVEGYIGKAYDVKPIQINGYKYNSSSENISGSMTEEVIKIYFKYLKETGLNVKYVDINTKEEVAEAKHYDCISSQEYDVTEDYQDIDSYTFIKDSGNTKGIMVNEGLDVIYYYAYNSSMTVKYYDIYTDKEIGTPEIIEGYEGKEYTLLPKEIDGYKLIKIDRPEGNMEREDTEVKYYYSKEITLTIKYMYKNTNEEIKEKKTYKYYSGDKYNLEEETKDIGEYKYVDTNIDLKGEIGSKDITIEIYYEIDKTISDIVIPEAGDIIITIPIMIVILAIGCFISIKELNKYNK